MPRRDDFPNPGNDMIELATLLRMLANDVERVADTARAGYQWRIIDLDGRDVGQAIYSQFGFT